MKKVLVIRFSSFGDVLQSLSIAGALNRAWPDCKIHWVTRKDFSPLVETHPLIQKVWSVEKGSSLRSLFQLACHLNCEKYTHIYDPHNNVRSRILCLLLFLLNLASNRRLRWTLRRSVYRWKRFLLFRFRINLFEMPFNGQRDQLRPLLKWGISIETPSAPQLFVSREAKQKAKDFIGQWTTQPYIALAPSAAYELKRWPLGHWKSLISQLSQFHFIILGGPEDCFLNQLAELDSTRIYSLVGQLSYQESAAVIENSMALVSNDTGLMHAAEQMGVPCIALMGPAPFGFPSREKTKIMELDLNCRPCSKHGQGPCTNPRYHQCLAGIEPSRVAQNLMSIVTAAVSK